MPQVGTTPIPAFGLIGVVTSTCMWLHVVAANDFGCIHWPVAFFLHIFDKFNKFIISCNGNGISHFQAHGPKVKICFWVLFWGGATSPSCTLQGATNFGGKHIGKVACWPPKEGNFREMPPSPKKCITPISPGGTHQASPLASCIGPGGQNLARACPQVFLASFCSWLLMLTLLCHLGLGVGCFLPQPAFW